MKKIHIYISLIILSIILISGINTYKKVKSLKSNKNKYKTFQNSTIKTPKGYSYITNFTFDNIRTTQIWSVEQDNDGTMLLADRKGIILFDGNSYKYFTFGKIPFVLKRNTSNKIFVGCNNGFGVLEKISFFSYKYKSLSDSLNLNDNFSKIEFIDNKVYFFGEKNIISYSDNKIITEYTSRNQNIKGYIKTQNDIILNILDNGFYSLQNRKNISISNSNLVENTEIIFSVKYENSTIFATNNNKLFYFDNNKITEYKTDADNYFRETIITGGIDIGNNEFAISTLNGGSVIINKKLKTTKNTLNYRTGLPDDEIFAQGIDANNGLWLAHEYGVSRVALNLPLKTYSNYPGIEGNINYIENTDTAVFVTTGRGVFYLSEVKNFKDIEVIIKKQDKIIQKKKKSNSNNEDDDIFKSDEEKKDKKEKVSIKNRVKKWFHRKKKDDDEVEDIVEEKESDNTKILPKKVYRYTNKIIKKVKRIPLEKQIYEMQSVKFAFKKIADINEKCKQTEKFNNGLLVASNSGLFFIKNGKSHEIIPNIYVYEIVKSSNSNRKYIVSSQGVFVLNIFNNEIKSRKLQNKILANTKVFSLVEHNENTLIGGGLNSAIKISLENNSVSVKVFKINNSLPEKVKVARINNSTILFLSESAYVYSNNKIEDEYKISSFLTLESKIFYPTPNSFVIIKNKKVIFQSGLENQIENFNYLQFAEKVNNIFINEKGEFWFIAKNNKLYKINANHKKLQHDFNLNIVKITTINDSVLNKENLNFDYGFGNIKIKISAPYYLKYNSVKYYYSLNQSSETNFIGTNGNEINISHFASGTHFINIYAVNLLNEKTEIETLKIIIKPPFTDSNLFRILVLLGVTGFVIFLSMYINRRKNRKIEQRNMELETEVEIRTAEIRLKSEHIEKQNFAIKDQNEQITKQHKEISHQHKKITDSIRYASKIQRAVLPKTDILDKYLSEYFIYFRPRDVVSGDFYWVHDFDEKLYIVAADCTGHGVPGGFLSMLGITFLNEIVNKANNEKRDIQSNEVLNKLREKVIKSLHSSEQYSALDGMDLSMVIIDLKKMTLDFSGANNPIFFIRNKELDVLKPNRMPIGYHRKAVSFTNTLINIQKGDTFYMFSDGYADQFGGEKKKKFSKNRLQELLLQLQDIPLKKQEKIVDDIILRWKGDVMQIDDMLLMGFRI